MNPVIPLPGTLWLHFAYKEFVPAYFHWSRGGRDPSPADEPWHGYAHMDAICTLQAALQNGFVKSCFMGEDGIVQLKPSYWRKGTRYEFIESGLLKDKKLSKDEENIFVAADEFRILIDKLRSGKIAEIFAVSQNNSVEFKLEISNKIGRPQEYDWHKYLIEAAVFLHERGTNQTKTAVYKHLQEKLGGADGGPSRAQLQTHIDPLIRRLQQIDRN